jgi:pimeloyl-ACP methyl ester carboxylesterase
MGLDAAEEIVAAVPGARLEVIERCGHVSTLEQPGAVTAHLARWITSATA